MMERHWTQESLEDFQFSVAYDYVYQLQDALEVEGMTQKAFAEAAESSESRVSQLFGNPGNLTLKSMIRWARAIGRKVSVVFYDDGDARNELGPVDSEVFLKCWEMAGRPRDLASIEEKEEEVAEKAGYDEYFAPAETGKLYVGASPRAGVRV